MKSNTRRSCRANIYLCPSWCYNREFRLFSTCWAIYERFSGYRPYSTIIFDFVMNFKCKPVLFLCTSASLNIKVNGRSLLSESDVRVIIKANVRSYHDHHELTFEIYKKKIAKLQKLFFGETFPDKNYVIQPAVWFGTTVYPIETYMQRI